MVAVAAVVLGAIISVVSTCCRKPVDAVASEPSVVYVTNEVEKVVTKEVIKTVPEIIERVVTNIVDRHIEVKIPVVSVVTTKVERVVCVTNAVGVGAAVTGDVTVPSSTGEVVTLSMPSKSGGDKALSADELVESLGMANEVKPPKMHKRVYCPEYIIKPGDEVLKLAKRYSFRIPDFRAVNPGVDENHVRIGQKVKIPGFFDEENLPK